MPFALPPSLQQHLLDRVTDGIYLIDQHGKIIYWNMACERLTGVLAQDMLNQSCEALNALLQTKYEVAGFLEGKADLFHQDSLPASPSRAVRHLDGRLIHIQAKPISMRDETNDSLYVGEIMQDVSIVRQAERREKGLLKRYERMAGGTNDRHQQVNMVGKDPAMQIVFQQVRQAAASDAAVLILGESGTGKELVADAIHQLSDRKEAPFVQVNCSAIPETLLESELFGHVKGAFTGAHADKKGRIETAEGGTLLLDEIGDVPPLMQVKLLRFLQEKTFERVGESETRQANVRIVSATNVDLKQAIADGRFREDLYYRLRVFPIGIPSLRERKDDIPVLIKHFLEKLGHKTGKQINAITNEGLQAMMDHPWPGNVRELENALEYAFVVCNGDVIEKDHLPPEVMHPLTQPLVQPLGSTAMGASQSSSVGVSGSAVQGGAESPAAAPAPSWEMVKKLKDPDYDRQVLLETLHEVRWNRSRAAQKLGCSRMTIWKKMKKYGLLEEDA